MATPGISTNLGNLDEGNFNLKIDNGDLDFLYKKIILIVFWNNPFYEFDFQVVLPHPSWTSSHENRLYFVRVKVPVFEIVGIKCLD